MKIQEFASLHEDIRRKIGFPRFEYIKKERLLSPCEDLNGILLLKKLSPGHEEKVIACSEHDELTLSFDPKEVAENATEEDIHDMLCSGIFYDESDGCFRILT